MKKIIVVLLGTLSLSACDPNDDTQDNSLIEVIATGETHSVSQKQNCVIKPDGSVSCTTVVCKDNVCDTIKTTPK